ncbi:DUF4833 domain-containing protein [Archangium sp.]|uniref:DUF4833 domain-containing protein n=1 Tax=Archangium sp. TaxID=1872627 RepID=UPI002D4A12BF|nr:DUF4833 domain-containing protein [Archangium sp.]HYO52228.1 DUF4833 domain-containing protein [Archangium sp.]
MNLRTWMRQGLPAVLLLCPLTSPADSPAPTRGVDSAFFISRSENRNQVHYGVRVGEDCRPQGSQPVHAYWRMLEKGEAETEPLLVIEGPAYGLANAQEVVSSPAGWHIRVRLRAYSERPIELAVARENGVCTTRAWMMLNETVCQLDHIYVRMQWPIGVDSIRLSGVTSDGRAVTELIRP